MTTLEAAVGYLARGWSVFPVRGKHPVSDWREYQTRRMTEEEARNAFADSTLGVAAVLGRLSGIVRVDADGDSGVRKLQELGGLPPTLEFSTPAGGRGYILSYLDGCVTKQLWRGAGQHEELRVQSDGAYTLLPPSPHPDCPGLYSWVNDLRPAAFPRWLRDYYVELALQQLTKELRPTLRQPERGEILDALQHVSADDYDRWVQVGMALKSAGEDYLETWVRWSRTSAKFKDGECEAKWNSFTCHVGGVTTRSILFWAESEGGYKSPNRHEPLTDLGNARILSRMGEGKVLHTTHWGWLAWDGRRWARDGAVKVVQEMQKSALEYRLNRAIESLVRHLKTDADADDFVEKRKSKVRTIQAIRKHEDENRVRGARALAESEPALSADYRQFDRHPLLLNCANGTLDLSTMELREHQPTDYLTQLCPVEFDPSAECPRWLQFLEDILPQSDVRQFLQQFLGCCLTGDVTAQIMPVFWGKGSNGKSTLVLAVMHVLGEDYSMKAKRDLLMVKRSSEHPTSVARLYRKRFVACVEASEESRLDEALVKELTGGDSIAARRMREDEWEFDPTHKPVLVTNHKPEVRGTDDAIWRRLPLIPFTVKFGEDDPRRDPELFSKLKGESEGILRWMVDGCKEWLRNSRRLERPGTVREASQTYRSEQDRIGQFLEDCCVVDSERKARVEKLTDAYTSWCIRNKHQQLNGNAFGRALSERGFPLESKGSKYRIGLDLRHD